MPDFLMPKTDAYINGIHIKNFSIVYSDEDADYSKRAAEYIQTEIKESTGYKLEIVEDNNKKTDNEIVVGNTDRAISSALNAETTGLEFTILSDANSIALEGDYFIIAAAAYYFIEIYFRGMNLNASIPTEATVLQPIVKEAKNFILLIGDGMGYYQTKLFEQMQNNVAFGDGEDIFYGYYLPYMGFSRTDSLSGITDSAAGGTALACGIKTNNRYVGKDKDGNDAKNLTEVAFELRKSGCVMSTDKDTGATPSAFSAHVMDRYNDSTEIIKDQIEAHLNYGTIIDCGFDYYNRDVQEIIEVYIEDNLKELSEDENGFFFMYEEGYIDKHCDDMNIAKAFAAMVRFNQAIGRFMEFAFYNPETFILITADHETGDLRPDENGVLEFNTTEHTSANVPIFAYGMGAELFDGVEIENIQISHTIAALMGNDNHGDQSVYQSLTKSK
jgi:alkaline phosphatase